jgi:methionyl aminopeptidase
MNILNYGAKFVKMREIGAITARCLDWLEIYIEPGISTADIDNEVLHFQQTYQVENAQYGYRFHQSDRPFPGHCCTSVNKVLCHGIPSPDEVLNDGDIVTVDITFKSKDGYHGDAARTYIVGQVPQNVRHFVEVSQCALQIGLQQCFPGNKIGNIGKYIEEYIAHNKMHVAEEFVGHGIGLQFHESPSIPHFLVEESKSLSASTRMEPGQTFTIEPIITMHKTRHKLKNDGWSVIGKSLAAQFEATVGINEENYEVFCK